MPRPSRYYPALLIALLATCLLFQYKNHHRPLPFPHLAITPPPYTNTPIHLSAATLPFPDFLAQLSRQSPVPVRLLIMRPPLDPSLPPFPTTPPALISLPITDFLLADLPSLLHLSPANDFTVAFDPTALILGPADAIYDPARAITRAYPLADLVTPSMFSDDSLPRRQSEVEDLIASIINSDSWRSRGGTLGNIAWSGTTALITTTPDIHFQIESLLNTLRHL